MTADGRTIKFSKRFLDELFAIQEYLSFYSKNYGNFMSEVIDFAVDTILPQPFAFPEYAIMPTPEKMYRKAVFRKNYILIYEVIETKVEFLLIYHSSRDPDTALLQ